MCFVRKFRNVCMCSGRQLFWLMQMVWIFFRLFGLYVLSMGIRCLVVMFLCIWNVVSCVRFRLVMVRWCSVLLLLVWVLFDNGIMSFLLVFCSGQLECVCIQLVLRWLCFSSVCGVVGMLCWVRQVGVLMISMCVFFSLCVIRFEFFSGFVCMVMLVCCLRMLMILLVSMIFSVILGCCVRNLGISGSRK